MFTVEEITILKMKGGQYLKKEGMLIALKDTLPFVEDEYMKEMLNGIIDKLEKISDKDYKRINYDAAMDLEE